MIPFFRGIDLRSKLVSGGFGILVLNVANLLLTLGLVVVLARLLGPDDYGVYAFAFALISLLSIPVQFGLPSLVVRETAKYQVKGEWGGMRGLWSWATVVVVCFTIILGVIILGVVVAFDAQVSSIKYQTFLYGMPLLPILGLGILRGAALRGLRHPVVGQLPERIITPVLLTFFVGILVVVCSYDLEPHHVMLLHNVAALVAFSVGALWLRKKMPPALRAGPLIIYEHRAWIMAALPLALLSGLQVINKNTDLILIGFFLDERNVGMYKVAAQASTIVSFGLMSANMLIAPYISRLFTQGEMEKLQKLLLISARVVLMLAILVVIVLVCLGKWLLILVFGPEYLDAYLPMVILGFGQLGNASFGSIGLLLNMTGYEKETLKGVLVGAVVNVVMNIILIPSFGLIGASISTSLTFLVWNVLLWRVAYHQLSLNTSVFGRRIRL